MKMYTDKALSTIQDNTAQLYAQMASVKPTDDLTHDDIRSIMYYLRAFQDMARTEETRRKIAKIKNRK